MPSHLKRYYGAGDLQFITCSCYHRHARQGTAAGRNLFLRVLEQVRLRYGFVVLGYVVMPEHFHLLISEPQHGDPSKVMQALKLGFARRVLARQFLRNRLQLCLWEKPPAHHIWQRRFYDFNVWTERKRVEKLRYIRRNPVRRGLVEAPDQWRWSSFRSYAYGEPGPVRINQTEVLQLRIRTMENTLPSAPHFSQRTREMGHP